MTFSLFLAVYFIFSSGFLHKTDKPKYIIIFLADSLRPDHMGCYGYNKNTTPFIDSVSREGLVFEKAFTTGKWTHPAIASLFTGLYPFQHKATHYYVNEDEAEDGEIKVDILSEDITTLAELLKKDGYKTYSLYTMAHLDKKFGFSQGFDKYLEVLDHRRIPLFKDFFINNKEHRLFFYFHFKSPHSPYGDIDNKFVYEFKQVMGEQIEDYPFESPLPESSLKHFQTGYEYKSIGDVLLSYDKEVYYIDTQFQELYEFLKSEGSLKDSLIILCSDHGESFEGRYFATHGDIELEETVHVPLIMWDFASRQKGRTGKTVSLIDILPTISEKTRIPLPRTQKYYGMNLTSEKDPGESRGIIAEDPLRDKQGNFITLGRILYRTADKKIILDTHDDNLSCYEITGQGITKKSNAQNFSGEIKSFKKILKAVKKAYFGKDLPQKQKKLTEEEVKKLKSLGYLQ